MLFRVGLVQTSSCHGQTLGSPPAYRMTTAFVHIQNLSMCLLPFWLPMHEYYDYSPWVHKGWLFHRMTWYFLVLLQKHILYDHVSWYLSQLNEMYLPQHPDPYDTFPCSKLPLRASFALSPSLQLPKLFRVGYMHSIYQIFLCQDQRRLSPLLVSHGF